MADVTQILSQIESGDPNAAEQLLPLIYKELRVLASRRMKYESPEHTLQATALVHEAYVRLVDVENAQQWQSRGHFFAAAAEAMRRILVERARQKRRLKRGGDWNRVTLNEIDLPVANSDEKLMALDDALRQLEQNDKRKADLVKLRFFAGLSIREAAAALGISTSTADNDWAYAKSWLKLEMQDEAR